jgi:hypothetical protein
MSADVEHDSESTNSFLDVITSSIGILIILVMVAGQHAQQIKQALARAPLHAEFEAAVAEAAALEGDVHQFDAQIGRVQAELAVRSSERNAISTVVVAIEQELAKRRAELDAEKQRSFDGQRDLNLAREELRRLEALREKAQQNAAPATVTVESYPTPLSKTVDNREAHFQLSRGRLAFVPFDTLVDRLKSSLRDYAAKLQDQGEITDTIGPIAGFRLRYSIERHDVPQGSFMQVSYLEFVPTSGELGELFDEAMAPGSAFRNKLEMMSPRQYTVTVWTYPDSFDEYRKLKKELFSLGYAVAARPLPEGMLIGASPQGSKSSAQ